MAKDRNNKRRSEKEIKTHRERVARHKAKIAGRGNGQMADLSGGAQQRLQQQRRGR